MDGLAAGWDLLGACGGGGGVGNCPRYEKAKVGEAGGGWLMAGWEV